jgi:hypothetical protein
MFNQAKIFLIFAIGSIIAVLVPVDLARGAEATLSLPEAVALALGNSPELAVERRQIDVAKGELTKARVYPLNPVLEVNPAYGSETRILIRPSVRTFDVAVSRAPDQGTVGFAHRRLAQTLPCQMDSHT